MGSSIRENLSGKINKGQVRLEYGENVGLKTSPSLPGPPAGNFPDFNQIFSVWVKSKYWQEIRPFFAFDDPA